MLAVYVRMLGCDVFDISVTLFHLYRTIETVIVQRMFASDLRFANIMAGDYPVQPNKGSYTPRQASSRSCIR